MPKNILQDMVKVKQVKNLSPKRLESKEVRFSSTRQGEIKERNKPRYKIWFVAIVSIAFFLFALSYMFSKATITITPKSQNLILKENLSASKDSASTLPFDLVIISGEESKEIQTTEQKDIFQKAKGVVVIYNAFSSSPQMLSIDTRLEGSNGKLYKTETKTVVPGKSKAGVPGSVEVKIYANEPGVEYNSAPLDFKILGFKGTSKYAGFYARSKG